MAAATAAAVMTAGVHWAAHPLRGGVLFKSRDLIRHLNYLPELFVIDITPGSLFFYFGFFILRHKGICSSDSDGRLKKAIEGSRK